VKKLRGKFASCHTSELLLR